VPVEVFANAPATDPTLTVALASATATSAAVNTPAGLPVADPTVFPPAQWRGSFLDPSGVVLERFVCTDSRTATLTLVRQAEDAVALPAGVWPVGTRVAHDLTAGAMGTVQQSLLHKWRRHATATQPIAANTTTTIALDTLDFDSANLDPGPANAATIRRAGLYLVSWGGLGFNNPAATVSNYGWVTKNGATAGANRIAPITFTTTVAGLVVLGGSDPQQLAVGDTLVVSTFTTVAQSNSLGGGLPFLSVVRLGD